MVKNNSKQFLFIKQIA